MILSLTTDKLKSYTSSQLNYFFPDEFVVDLNLCSDAFDLALQRLEFCFNQVIHTRYHQEGQSLFNHLYSDHYVMFIWFLSNSIWKETNNINLASKLYYLNKNLHGFDCMYDTKLPHVFLIFHGVGTMLGKAEYNDYFVAFQGCTVGSHVGKYPKIGKGVSLTAHSSLIGDCVIGDRVSVSAYTSIFQKNIASDITVYRNDMGSVIMKPTQQCYAQQFFNVNLKESFLS